MFIPNKNIKKIINNPNIKENIGIKIIEPPKNKTIDNKIICKRDIRVVLFFILITFLIFYRLWYINEYSSEFLRKMQANNVVRNIEVLKPRNVILDRNNIGLAISTPMKSIYFNFKEFKKSNNQESEVIKFNYFLKKNGINIDLFKLSKNRYLAQNINPDINSPVKIGGIYFYENYKRFYPLADSLSNLLGKTNIDDSGIDGLEYSRNQELKKTIGLEKIQKDLKGNIVDSNIISSPEQGNSLKLTIDSQKQLVTYNLLKQQVIDTKAKAGAVIVLNAKTGEILSMASYPSFNPNVTYKKTIKNIDPTYQSVFDPGSIMKPLVIAKAIDDKKVNVNTVISTNPYKVGNKLIKDDHPMNSMTVSKVIQYSSDIGTSKIALMFQSQDLYNYYKSLGFGSKSGLHLSGETSGILNNYKRWTPTDQALMSFGYGISINLLQIASSYTIFTNDGCYIKPSLFIESKNNFYCNQIITPNTAKTLRSILESTVTDGTAKKASSGKYSVAGKTGTAQKLVNGRYVNNAHVASFVGFAPVNNPQYIIAVMIDEPKTGYYAATTSAPLFSKIMDYFMSGN